MTATSTEGLSVKQRTIIMIGLGLALFASCFDGTVTTTCGPIIAEQFNASDLLPWLTTGYLLMETVTIPISGKLSDLYGRKKILLIGLALFGGASLVAGVAWDMYMVIVARALQGAGGGILIPVATAAVSDLYPGEQRAKIQGILGALYGIGMGLGPFIGGAFASIDDIAGLHGWHFAFLINLPIVLLVLLLTLRKFPVLVNDSKPKIDYLGGAVISALLITMVFFFELLGKSFSIVSIGTLVFVLIMVVLFNTLIHIENKAEEPILAPRIFRNPTVKYAAIILFILGFAMVGDELFTGLYLQEVTGHTPEESGFFILMMVVGMVIASTIGGLLINRIGAKPLVVTGPALMATGFFMFSMIEVEFNLLLFSSSEFLFGLGAGCLLSSLMVSVQNSCNRDEVGMTTSAVNLFRNIGSTIGTSVLTLIVSAVVYGESLKTICPIDDAIGRELSGTGIGILDHIGEYGPVIDDAIKTVFTDSVATAFGFGALLLMAAVYFGFKFRIENVSHTEQVIKLSEEISEKEKE